MKVIPKWTPWWEKGVEKVKVVGETQGEEDWPEIREIKEFSSICVSYCYDFFKNLYNVLL